VSELQFEWDTHKAAANLARHGVSFDEASTVFRNPLGRDLPDDEHSSVYEERFVTVGISDEARLLYVSFTMRGDRIRIIGARKATRHERLSYEEGL
jgi:uncharacterized protein